MKKNSFMIMVLLMLVTSVSFASGIEFADSHVWKDLLERAKKENKMIFLDAYASWCGPCKYMQNTVFTDESVGAYFNTGFINAKINMEEGEGPELAKQLGVTAYPTFFFLNADGKVVHKYVGAMKAADLIELGKTAADPAKQYYPRKEQAASGNMDPKAFAFWANEAVQAEDEDLKTIIQDYLAKHPERFINKDILELVLNQSADLTAQQVDMLRDSAASFTTLLGYSEAGYDNVFKAKVLEYALNNSVKGTGVDFTAFSVSVKKYLPLIAALETQKMRVKYYFLQDEPLKGVNELIAMFNQAVALKLNAETMADMVMRHAQAIAASKKVAVIAAQVKAYQLTRIDASKGYYKDMTLLALYHYDKNETLKKAYARKLVAGKNTPEEMRATAKSILEPQI